MPAPQAQSASASIETKVLRRVIGVLRGGSCIANAFQRNPDELAVSSRSVTAKTRKKARKKAAKAQARGPFARVWSIVKRVPRGRVVSYGQLAELIEHRLSPVGIGWAIRAAAPGSIPWHRVINSRGGISTDREHPGRQRALLEAEGVRFDAEGRVDLERVGWRPRRTGRWK